MDFEKRRIGAEDYTKDSASEVSAPSESSHRAFVDDPSSILRKRSLDDDSKAPIDEMKVLAGWQKDYPDFLVEELTDDSWSDDDVTVDLKRRKKRGPLGKTNLILSGKPLKCSKKEAFERVEKLISTFCNELLAELPHVFIQHMTFMSKKCLSIYMENRSGKAHCPHDLESMAGLATACIYISARNTGYPFSVRELTRFAKIVLNKTSPYITLLNLFNVNLIAVSHPAQFLPRFVDQLGVPPIVEVQANRICCLWNDRNSSTVIIEPHVVAGTAIFIAVQRLENLDDLKAKDVADVLCLPKNSLQRAITDLTIFFSDFCKALEVQDLHSGYS